VKKTLVAVLMLILGLSTAQAQKLTGAGATFPYPIYSKWFSEYSAAHPGVEVNYQAIGSGGGIRQVTAGLVDFGASDGPMTDEQLASSKVKAGSHSHGAGRGGSGLQCSGRNRYQVQRGCAGRHLSGKDHKLERRRIAKDNPGVTLPDQKIIVVHRSDGSGTTYIWTDYLSKVSTEWANGPGKGTSPSWPVGVGGSHNEGVAGLIRQLPGALGYIELIYALQNHISYGEVKNPAGNWIKASIDGVTEAAASVKQMPADYRVSITNAPGANAYPISSFTWLLIPVKSADPAKGKVLKDMLSWIITSGEPGFGALIRAVAEGRCGQGAEEYCFVAVKRKLGVAQGINDLSRQSHLLFKSP
jgi:phosphate transport system substrate-binding protein